MPLIEETQDILDKTLCMFFMDSILRSDAPLGERIAVVKVFLS